MATLHPYCQLRDLLTDSVVASTSTLLSYEIGYGLDKLGTLTLEFGAGDAGDAPTSGDAAFASALLSTTSSTPVALLLEFSLDGGSNFDSRRLARSSQRTFAAGRRAIREDGTDIGDILSTSVINRQTLTDVRLDDAFSGVSGAIVPLSLQGIAIAGEAVPWLCGILPLATTATYNPHPGLSTWANAARNRLVITAIINPDLAATATNVDIDSLSVLAAVETIVNRLAGAAPGQHWGHWVLDPSTAGLNLSGHTNFSPPPTATTGALVIGHVPTSAYLTFDASASTDVTESTTARVHLEQATAGPGGAGEVFESANFIGGQSTAGFPLDSHVTSLAVVNGVTGYGMSAGREEWYDALPVIGLSADSGKTGGAYITSGDGQVFGLPGAPQAAVTAMAQDAGNTGASRSPALLLGTPHGVYQFEYTSGSEFSSPTVWSFLGGLNAPIARLQVEIDPGDAGNRIIYALVTNHDKKWDGVWRHTAAGGWKNIIGSLNVLDCVTTDFGTVWLIHQGAQTKVFRYQLSAGTWAADPATGFSLGTANAFALARVCTVPTGDSPASDSVWALVAGDSSPGVSSPAYYFWNVGSGPYGGWAGPYDCNQDSTLVGPNGEKLTVYCATGLGVTFDQAQGGPTPTVMVGTDLGAYWSEQTLGGVNNLNWHKVDHGGLGNFAIRRIAAGEAQTVLGRSINRLYCATEDDVLVSNSSGRWFSPLKGRDRTTAGVHLSAVTLSINNANGAGTGYQLPSNRIRTWGTKNADGSNMTTSPVGAAANTHVYVPSSSVHAIPQGYWWERALDGRSDFAYTYHYQSAALPGTQLSQLPELQGGTSVDAPKASAAIVTVARRWLPQHGTPQVQLVLQSSFDTTASKLRTLRPTHKVALVGDVTVTDLSSAGAAVSTQVLHYDGSETLYVLAHSIKMEGSHAVTTTTVGSVLLATPISESDMAAGLADAISVSRTWR